MSLPPITNYVGISVYTQWLVADPGASNSVLAGSQGFDAEGRKRQADQRTRNDYQGGREPKQSASEKDGAGLNTRR